MQEQSRIIPRFWIDDVFITGILLSGYDQVKWIDYKNSIKWAYYNFWDLEKKYGIYELYIAIKKLLNIFNIADYYRNNHFIVLHIETSKTEINYENFNDNTFNNILLKAINSSLTLNDSYGVRKIIERNLTCFKFDNIKKSISFTNEFLNCFSTTKNFYNYHFNKFCHKLWSN